MKYELRLVSQAEAEVARIIHFLAERSPQGAAAWCESWEKILGELLRSSFISSAR